MFKKIWNAIFGKKETNCNHNCDTQPAVNDVHTQIMEQIRLREEMMKVSATTAPAAETPTVTKVEAPAKTRKPRTPKTSEEKQKRSRKTSDAPTMSTETQKPTKPKRAPRNNKSQNPQ